MMELVGVSKRYGTGAAEVVALEGVDLRVADGEFVAIVGPSGSGKSTMLQLMGALDRPTEGSVVVEGETTAALSARERTRLRQRSIGFVFQQFNLIPTLSAARNVEAPMAPLGIARSKRLGRSLALLEALGLEGRSDHLPVQLARDPGTQVAIRGKDDGLIRRQ